MLLHVATLLIFILLGLAILISGPLGRLLVAGVAVLLAPGYLVWALTSATLRLPRLATPALWIGLSLSLIPVIFLWSSTLGLRLTPFVLRLQAIGIGLLVLWHLLHHWPRLRSPTWLLVGYSFLLSLVALTRALEVRGVVLPLWVDSLHHTLLVRIIGETGRIPTSLRPYLPVDNLPYHWGYHAVIATWRELANVSLPEAMLWSGQVLNACIMPVMYAMGAAILRSPRSGLVTAGVVGLLSLMPAYYVTWGRYTQLAGLLLLPSLLIVSMALLERPVFSWRLLWLAVLLLSGLLLIHYRVVFFYGAFMLPYGTLLVIRRLQHASAMVARSAALVSFTIILCGPWVLLLLQRMLLPLTIAPATLASNESYNSLDWSLLLAGNNYILLGLAGGGAMLAMAARRWRLIAVASWIGIMTLLANAGLLGVRPSWLINNHAVVITLFMPIGVLVGYFINALLHWIWMHLPQPARAWGHYAAVGAFSILALLGAWQLRSVVNPATVLATAEDMRAIEWVAEQTAPDARFLVNSAHWLNGSPRGTDAGWWLLPLAGRWVSTPPALYIYGEPEYKQAVEDLNDRVSAHNIDTLAEINRIVRDEQITHIFIGKQGGPIKPSLLLGHPLFVPIYNWDGVMVFAVRA